MPCKAGIAIAGVRLYKNYRSVTDVAGCEYVLGVHFKSAWLNFGDINLDL